MSYNISNHFKISIMQHNCARITANMHTCLEIGLERNIDFILVQEPWIARDNIYTISHTAYHTILPEFCYVRPKIAVFAKKNSIHQFCYRSDLCKDSDIIILDILNSEIPDFQIMNVYNEKSLKENYNDWTLNRILPHIKPQKYSIIYRDFNAHHSWWNLDVLKSIRTNELVQWLNQHQFKLLNKPDISIFYRQNMRNILIIDLAFTIKALNQSKSIFWQIDENVNTGSDYEVILFLIQSEGNLVENLLGKMPYNLEKADWKEFHKELKDSSNQAEFQWNPAASSQVEELEKRAENLQILIQKAAEKTILKRKASSRSKPWWNDHISELRKTLSREKNRWKKSRTEENHKQYQQARNCYFNEIKMVKSNYWNQFLEKAEGKDIFKAFAYTK